MSTSDRLNETPMLLVSYDEMKRHLLLDHDEWRADVTDAIQEVVDEIGLATNDEDHGDDAQVVTTSFAVRSSTYTVSGYVLDVLEVRDADGETVEFTTEASGTAIVITPAVDDSPLPLTVTFNRLTVRPVLRRVIKEMVAFKLAHRGDDSADYPPSIRRVLQQLTKFRI